MAVFANVLTRGVEAFGWTLSRCINRTGVKA
jgi:hypothetical protein